MNKILNILLWFFSITSTLIVVILVWTEQVELAKPISIVPFLMITIKFFNDFLLLEKQQKFDLAFSTEGAKLLVNKQGDFGDEYLALVDEFISYLFKEGPHEKFLEYAQKLTKKRQQYSLWLKDDVDKFLSKFEYAIRFIGAQEGYLKHVPVGEERSKVVNEIYDKMKTIYKKEDEISENEQSFHRDKIVADLKMMIGIPQIIENQDKFKY